MSGRLNFSAIGKSVKIDSANGVIYGVCVMREGEAKGHGVRLDRQSLEGARKLAAVRPDGVGTRFGDDHEAKAKDFNGSLKEFRIEGDGLYADLHLLKTDAHFDKVLEMADKISHEFGLSVVSDADKEISGKDESGNPKYKFKSPIRFTELQCVDIVSAPAATNGLFFSQTNNQKNMTKIALALGLPETATEAEIETAAGLALAAKTKMDTEAKKKLEAEAEAKKKLDAEGDAEGKKDGKFAALEASVLELSKKVEGFNAAAAATQAAAHKSEIESLKLEAGKDGKVIALSDESLLKLSVPEIKDMIAKLPKGQVKLTRGNTLPVNKDGQKLDKRSPEFREFLAQKRDEGALALGRKMAQN